jgi:hypothetical protein
VNQISSPAGAQTFRRGVVLGERLLIAIAIDHSHPAGVVIGYGVIQEGNPVSRGGDARFADVAGGPIQRLADRPLQLCALIRLSDDGHLLALRRPVRKIDPILHGARSATGNRGAGQHSGQHEAVVREPCVLRQRQLAGRRDGEQRCARES